VCHRQDEAAGPGAPPTKTIVFSTFTRALDLLERRLRPGNIGFLRLDGRMRLSQRTDTIRAFARDPQVRGSCPLSGAGCTVRQQ
jgi:SNF2 family DNA or RNA helicase